MTAETETARTAGSCCSSTGSCHDGAADAPSGGVTTVQEPV
ncbi:copper-binding protein, partial [Streptomyces sp. MBT51]|nr:copper-binding protein [Streptomyces sp. MBT51]